ncbi:hypothetical protein TD95_002268 [Thielaviopsis punctulata]|uniref:Histone deacetylase domain-containing protein n=1 Tax=Thielaviopsis punctulata TaxID=72032 RepID=A0A0F4ZI96_9PEZI|nr:hypothetical protein TD95_002268 [Thielaviopsis punctulata]
MPLPPSRPAAASRQSSLAAAASPNSSTSRHEMSSSQRSFFSRSAIGPSSSPRAPSLHLSKSSSSLRASVNQHSTSPSNRFVSSRSSSSLDRSSSVGSSSKSPSLNRKTSTSSLHSTGTTPLQTPSHRSSMMSKDTLSPLPRSPLSATHPPTIDEVPTAEAIAADHFISDLSAHGSPQDHRSTELVVVLNDACYGHRFSRPRTSRNALNTIVERPERIRAAALGIAMAYVRLGGRHAEGHNPIHPKVHPTSIDRIPFRIHKTERRVGVTTPTVTNVHGTKWMEELKMMCENAEARLASGGKDIQRVDSKRDADNKTPLKLHDGDLYLCGESLDAFEGALGAVCDAVDMVFRGSPSRAFVGVRPPGHHCSSSVPSGFCWINNVHVGIMHAAMTHGLTHAAIIDIDLHHGDGSQSIAWQHNARAQNANKNASAWKKSHIGYFSLHDINSYPCELGDEDKIKNASLCIEGAHGQSIWNTHLQPWKSDSEFWSLYKNRYMVLLEKARAFLTSQAEQLDANGVVPKAAIFISTGFDASQWETVGMQRHNINVPTEFYARIAQDIVRLANEEETSAEGRVISIMEGGYSDRALSSGVLSHLSGLAGDQVPGPLSFQARHGLGTEMGHRLGSLSDQMMMEMEMDDECDFPSLHAYDSSWWSNSELIKVEALLAPPPVEPKKPRVVGPPTYSSPTQASSARKVEPRLRRSVSQMSSVHNSYYRPVTPPPPDVMWETASFELLKQLIPLDRPTESCTFEELNAEVVKARKERQASTTLSAAPTRAALRERKAKASSVDLSEDARAARRRTVSSSAALATAERKQTTTSRRVSAASTAPFSSYDSASVRGRPSTSMTIRGSSASVSSLNVKKVRSSASTTFSTSPVSRREPIPPAKRHVAQRPSTSSSRATSSVASTPSFATTRPSTGSPRSVSGDPLDQVTNGVRRMKMTLSTREQREARQRAEMQSQSGSLRGSPTISSSSGSHLDENKPVFLPPTDYYAGDPNGHFSSPDASPRQMGSRSVSATITPVKLPKPRRVVSPLRDPSKSPSPASVIEVKKRSRQPIPVDVVMQFEQLDQSP